MNLIEKLLIHPIENGAAKTIVIQDDEGCFSYQDLYGFVIQFTRSTALSQFSVGDRIACVLHDTIESIALFFALIYLGLEPCLMNVELSQPEIEARLLECQCKAVIKDEEMHLESSFTLLDQKALLSDLATIEPARQHHEIAFSLYTSGTTGKPSLVLHKHADPILMNQHYGTNVLNITAEDRITASSRFYFAYGLNTLFFALYHRACLILPPRQITPMAMLNHISTYKATLFFSVPTMLKRILEAQPSSAALSTLRLCISAGENLPQGIYQQWLDQTGTQILDGIGTTEVLSTFISNRLDKVKLGSTGFPVPGFEAKILEHQTDKPLGVNKLGILWIKGDTYVDYYPNNEAASKERFVDGWFKTNDLFTVDEDGFYFYHGRANALFKSSGIWINPYKLEQVLSAHPKVREVIVMARKESDGLMRSVATVVVDANHDHATLSIELKNWCKSHCSKQEYPHFIRFVDSLPKTASGKLIRTVS